MENPTLHLTADSLQERSWQAPASSPQKLLEELQARCLSLAREAAEAAIQSRRASAKAASTSAPEASQAGGGIPCLTPLPASMPPYAKLETL